MLGGLVLYAPKYEEVIRTMRTKLMKMEYFDLKAETCLETYADTVVIEKEGNASFITAVRFGGYPESVKGMSDAIYGGGSVTVEIDGEPVILCSHMKQYRRELSHDGIYAEATLIIRDGEVNAGNGGEEDKNADKPACPVNATCSASRATGTGCLRSWTRKPASR